MEVIETYDCDIVVCGVGISGLVAAVQAASNGNSVIAIEKQGFIGGNGMMTEGIFAVDSPLQKEAGMEVDRSFIMHKEIQLSQWITDGEQWSVLLENSGKNIAWLLEQGVTFQWVGDGDVAEYPVIHFFEGGRAAVALIPPLKKTAQELGVEIMVSTPLTGLIVDDGVVRGVYAQKKNGDTIQINAKAVILGTGSYAQNEGYLRQRGWNLDGVTFEDPIYTGDAIRLAIEQAGALSFVPYATFNAFNWLGNFEVFNMFVYHALSNPGDALWVNQNGVRFIYENYADENYMVQCTPALTQKKIFTVFDRATLENWASSDELFPTAGYTPMDLAAIDAGDDPALVKGDTLEEAAEKSGLDPDALAATVKRYNELCAGKLDLDFGKDPSHLKPIEKAPFYIGHVTSKPAVMIGGIQTDIHSRVINEFKEPIAGLYAIGADGCMLYRNVYTFETACAGANAHNINSARVAANHARDYLTNLSVQ